MKRKERIGLIIGIILAGVWFLLALKSLGIGDSPAGSSKTMSPTSNVRFNSNSVGITDEVLPVRNNSISPIYHRETSIPLVENYHFEVFQNASAPIQNGGNGTLYSTASVSPHSYGGGGTMAGSYYQNSRSDNSARCKANNFSSMNEYHTFMAMSTKVRTTSEEFEDAMGSDNLTAVRRRTPGSGPITDDPGHQPTVVGSTPVGEGMWFLVFLAIGYFVKNLLAVKIEKKL